MAPLACGGSCAAEACSCLQAFFFSCVTSTATTTSWQIKAEWLLGEVADAKVQLTFSQSAAHSEVGRRRAPVALWFLGPLGLTAGTVAVLWAGHQTCSCVCPELRGQYETKQNLGFVFSLQTKDSQVPAECKCSQGSCL